MTQRMEDYSEEIEGMARQLPYPCTLNDAALNGNYRLASLLLSMGTDPNAEIIIRLLQRRLTTATWKL